MTCFHSQVLDTHECNICCSSLLSLFQMAYSESLISEIFGGKLQSSVTRQHKKESVTVQPFFSLQLDVQVSSPGPVQLLTYICVYQLYAILYSKNSLAF